MHSPTLRTLAPISRPMSQQAVMKASIEAFNASPVSVGGNSTSTSTSECGNSSPRP